MNPFANPLAHALGWTLLHFCWQGAAIALLLWFVLGALGTRSSPLRYAAACTALALMVVLPLATFIRLAVQDYRLAAFARTPVQAIDIVFSAGMGTDTSPWTAARLSIALDHALPWLLAVWCVGVACFLARLGLGLVATRTLRSTGDAVSAELRAIFDGLRVRLNITRAVELLHSARVEVPTVIGWLRPVVLLPASCLSGLAPDQIEAILCHELAHIRRHDYLVSVLQSVMETLLFYHPAVWWVSRQVRRERECCCDEFAVRAGGDVLAYARTLALLEEQRSLTPQLALAANGGALKMRIQRLLGRPEGSAASQFTSIAVLVLLAASALGLAGHIAWAETHAVQAATTLSPMQATAQLSTPSVPANESSSDRSASHESSPTAPSGPEAAAASSAQDEPAQAKALENSEETRNFLAQQLDALKGRLEEQNAAFFALAARQQNVKQLSDDDLRRLEDVRRSLKESQDQYNDVLAKLAQVAAEEARIRAEQSAKTVNMSEVQKQLAEAQAAIARLNSEGLRRQMEETARDQAHLNSPEFRRQMEDAAKAAKEIEQLSAQLEVHALLSTPSAGEAQALEEQSEQPAFIGVHVSSGVMRGQIISAPQPFYPPIAKAAHVQGTVVLHAVISKEGTVESLDVISGAPMLVQSARDAVGQWTFRPYISNGQPVEVETTISVDFTLADPAKSAASGIGSGNGSTATAVTPDGEPARPAGGNVTPPAVIQQVAPSFSEEARKAKFNGTVLVGLIVNSAGEPVNVHVIQGVGMGLDEKAVEAVRQYRFRPAMENGKPVPVALNVQVNFKISDGPKPAPPPPDMSCTYYGKKDGAHDGTCEEGTSDKGHYYCRANDNKGNVEPQSGCEWKVKQMLDWQRDHLSPSRIQIPSPDTGPHDPTGK